MKKIKITRRKAFWIEQICYAASLFFAYLVDWKLVVALFLFDLQNIFCGIRNDIEKASGYTRPEYKFRIRYSYNWHVGFWTWRLPLGYLSLYCDGWNNQFNTGFFCIGWMTPPLKSDQ